MWKKNIPYYGINKTLPWSLGVKTLCCDEYWQYTISEGEDILIGSILLSWQKFHGLRQIQVYKLKQFNHYNLNQNYPFKKRLFNIWINFNFSIYFAYQVYQTLSRDIFKSHTFRWYNNFHDKVPAVCPFDLVVHTM